MAIGEDALLDADPGLARDVLLADPEEDQAIARRIAARRRSLFHRHGRIRYADRHRP